MPDAPLLDLVVRLRNHVADPADGLADADLLQRYVRERDAVAFEALVWRHARLVMGVCRRSLRHRQDAEDAFQATFLLLARKAQRIRRGAALAAWLHTTALRVAGRARKRRLARPAELPEVLIDDVPPELREAGTVLDDSIRRLPARLRTAFVMCELEGRTHADAARELGCPKGTIDSRMAAARRRLRERLVRRGITLSPAIIVGAVGNEWALGELPRQTVACISGALKKLPPAVVELAAQSSFLSRTQLIAAALIVATVGTTAAIGNWQAKEPPAKEKSKVQVEGISADMHAFSVSTSSTWKHTTVGMPKGADVYAEERQGAVAWLTRHYDAIIEECRKSNRPLIPPATPQALGSLDFVIYSTDLGVGSIAIHEKKEPDALRQGAMWWHQDFEASSVEAARNLGPRDMLDRFLTDEPIGNTANQFLNRTLSSTFTFFDGFICSVDTLSILPSAKWTKERADPRVASYGVFNDVMRENMFKIIDADSGKLTGKLCGGESVKNAPIKSTLYVGSPAFYEESCFATHERDQVLRLSSFEWKKAKRYPIILSLEPKVDWKTMVQFDRELVRAPEPLIRDPHRRIHAIHLIKADDLILCPTHLGRVVAVEAKTGKVAWTHEYAPLDVKRFSTFAPEWVVVPPVVVGDKYVYAPADFPELLCLNVADGKKVWSVKKGDGLYPAVVGEQVLVIGSKTLRSLSLKDGSEQWKLDLAGLPCGRGAMLGDTYLLPFSEPKTWKGMIAIVDPRAGKIIEVLKPEKDEPIGNLVVHQDFLISQTLTEIAAFPIKMKE